MWSEEGKAEGVGKARTRNGNGEVSSSLLILSFNAIYTEQLMAPLINHH